MGLPVPKIANPEDDNNSSDYEYHSMRSESDLEEATTQNGEPRTSAQTGGRPSGVSLGVPNGVNGTKGRSTGPSTTAQKLNPNGTSTPTGSSPRTSQDLREVPSITVHRATISSSSRPALTPPNEAQTIAIHTAASTGDIPTLEGLVAYNVSITFPALGQGGSTALHTAAWHGKVLATRYLLDAGAAVDAVDEQGQTPLLLAVWAGHSGVAKVLIEHGANFKLRTRGECATPLHLAADGGHLETVELLLEKGAEVNAVDAKGWTALHDASSKGHNKVVKLLLSHGGDPGIITTKDRVTALGLAEGKGKKDVARLLSKANKNKGKGKGKVENKQVKAAKEPKPKKEPKAVKESKAAKESIVEKESKEATEIGSANGTAKTSVNGNGNPADPGITRSPTSLERIAKSHSKSRKEIEREQEKQRKRILKEAANDTKALETENKRETKKLDKESKRESKLMELENKKTSKKQNKLGVEDERTETKRPFLSRISGAFRPKQGEAV
jgi:ankyrin repeat protein